ncbi:MAG TPA: hypothetical protein VF641_10845 [Methylobacterium sp.]|jgi:hypothetical protein
MSATLTARQRVERLVLVQLLRIILEEGVGNKGHADVLAASSALSSVKVELVGDLSFEAGTAILRRHHQMVRRCISSKLRVGHPLAELGYSAFYIFERLNEEGAIVIGAESALAAALDLILPAIERASADAPAQHRARVKAAEIFAALQAEGCFPGVPWRERADA